MSRSASHAAAGVAGAVLGVLGMLPAPTAAADGTAPVRAIVAPVLDIAFAESDLARAARVERTPRRVEVTLDATVLFGKDSAVLSAQARRRLADVGAQLRARGPGAVTVAGYTDDLGSAAHGRVLSRQRADAVARVLRRDLPAATFAFTVAGRGEADPAVPNTSEANRRINRRVVVVDRPR